MAVAPRPASGTCTSHVRTSSSHPITVSWICSTPAGGRLGLCFCPGKKVLRGGVRHERSLQQDLTTLSEVHGVDTIACLLNDAELRSFHLRDYAAVVARANFQLLRLPIVEMSVPDDFQAAAALIGNLASRLGNGSTAVVHCRGGVGRAGMVAACVLLLLGQVTTAQAAIAQVRKLRCKTAVETRKQEDFVARYASWLVQQQQQQGQEVQGQEQMQEVQERCRSRSSS